MPTTADAGSTLITTLARAAGFTVLLVGAGLALVFAFAAALVVGLMILGAAVALRFFPAKPARGASDVLEARRTPTGWVVEARAPKS